MASLLRMSHLPSLMLDSLARSCADEAQRRRLTILVGAGASMLSPTKLPSGYDLKRMMIEDLCDAPGLRRRARTILASPGFQSMVPEVLFQRIYDRIGDRLFQFFDVLQGASPNDLHHLVAILAEQFRTPVLTTNFENLIEMAGARADRVIHLHGELSDPREMVVRLHQVGRGLSPKLAKRVGRAVEGRVLCVVGYSGNDEDVRLLLREHPPMRILWLVRDPNDYALQNIQQFFGRSNISVAQGSLEQLTRTIRRLLGVKRSGGPPSYAARRPGTRKWHEALSLSDRHATVSEALLEVRQYVRSAETADAGGSHCALNEELPWFQVQAATALRMCGRSVKALKHAESGVALARKFGSNWDRAAALNALGLVHLEKAKTDPKLARKYLRRAARVLPTRVLASWSDSNIVLMARIFNNLGLAELELGNETEARAAFTRSLQIKRKIGDLSGEATTAANMAVLSAQHGRARAASYWRRRSLHLIERYDQKYRAAYLYRRLGIARCEAGDLAGGMNDLDEALNLYRDIGVDRLGLDLTSEAIAKYGR